MQFIRCLGIVVGTTTKQKRPKTVNAAPNLVAFLGSAGTASINTYKQVRELIYMTKETATHIIKIEPDNQANGFRITIINKEKTTHG